MSVYIIFVFYSVFPYRNVVKTEYCNGFDRISIRDKLQHWNLCAWKLLFFIKVFISSFVESISQIHTHVTSPWIGRYRTTNCLIYKTRNLSTTIFFRANNLWEKLPIEISSRWFFRTADCICCIENAFSVHGKVWCYHVMPFIFFSFPLFFQAVSYFDLML